MLYSHKNFLSKLIIKSHQNLRHNSPPQHLVDAWVLGGRGAKEEGFAVCVRWGLVDRWLGAMGLGKGVKRGYREGRDVTQGN